MAQTTILHLIEPPLARLGEAEHLALRQAPDRLRVDDCTVLHRAPEQHQLAVARPYRRRHVGDQPAGVDAGVDVVQRAPDLLGLAVVKRPERAVGTAIFRRQPAVQVDDAEPPLLQQGRLGIINLHGGLSPEYRGADCTFWALYNGEPEKVGCTLHYIDAGIDTGRLIAHVSPAVRSGDSELVLFWRAVQDSAVVYAQAIGRLAQGEVLGLAQPGKGRLYQVKDRGLRHERQLEARLPGMLAKVELPLRVRWFAADREARRTP